MWGTLDLEFQIEIYMLYFMNNRLTKGPQGRCNLYAEPTTMNHLLLITSFIVFTEFLVVPSEPGGGNRSYELPNASGNSRRSQSSGTAGGRELLEAENCQRRIYQMPIPAKILGLPNDRSRQRLGFSISSELSKADKYQRLRSVKGQELPKTGSPRDWGLTKVRTGRGE
ncbi:hypothetical protein J6590_046577 [Homalodisca vitripennis]|nr:hypothetical protein J6590_046577 [Homalodisca vitripennis]